MADRSGTQVSRLCGWQDLTCPSALACRVNLPCEDLWGTAAIAEETLGPTYGGLSHWRVLNFTPVPQVREQEPNGVQAPQLPSRLRMSGVSQMQCPLKQCCRTDKKPCP